MSTVPAGLTAEIGVIGGSGFYALTETMTDVVVDTPYGPTSDPIGIGAAMEAEWPVTDGDAGAEGSDEGSVTQEEVFRFFAANVDRLRQLIGSIIARLPAGATAAPCGCAADAPPLP